MASGRPDWYGSMSMHGKFGDDYKPVAVDSEGNLVAIMTGSDGVDSQVILTDASGRMISILYDPVNDRFIAIDSDGFLTTVLKGNDGGVLRTVEVDGGGRIVTVLRDPVNDRYLSIDADGYLVSVMKGLDGATLRTIAVDANGIMKANLSVQDLNFLTVRPAYGSVVLEKDNDAIPDSEETELILIEGQGVIYDGIISSSCGDTPASYKYRIKVDGSLILDYSVTTLYNYSKSLRGRFPLIMGIYDTENHNYLAMINSIITFEESFGVYIYQTTGAARATWWDFRYALTP